MLYFERAFQAIFQNIPSSIVTSPLNLIEKNVSYLFEELMLRKQFLLIWGPGAVLANTKLTLSCIKKINLTSPCSTWVHLYLNIKKSR